MTPARVALYSQAQDDCLTISRDVVATISGMAGSAGHAALMAALTGAARRGNRAYTCMWAAYGHTSKSLATAGQGYAEADQGIARQIRTLAPGFFHGGAQP
jgi:hypothetical protein